MFILLVFVQYIVKPVFAVSKKKLKHADGGNGISSRGDYMVNLSLDEIRQISPSTASETNPHEVKVAITWRRLK